MVVLEFDLYRVNADGQCDHARRLGRLQLSPQTANAWLQLTSKAGDLGQNAQSGGLICIKLYANLHVRDEHRDHHQPSPVELEFYPDSIKVRIANYGSTLRKLRPFEQDYFAGGSISRNKLAAELRRHATPAVAVAGGIHIR